MPRRVGPLVIGGVALVLGGAAVLGEANVRLPGDQQGYAPEQPIAFSHRLHAGELQIDCQYCHSAAETSRHATVPPLDVCMNCHRTVTAGWDVTLAERQAAVKENRDPRRIVSARLRPLFDAVGLDETGKPDPSKAGHAVAWTRVHALPSFVAFSHARHVARGVACQACHGPVETMERIRQESTLAMGWCIECHRANEANGTSVALPPVAARAPGHVSTDCAACHY
jgi:hypothetical protein